MTLSFKYNVDGIRTQKTVNGTATNYFLNGNKILAQKTGSTVTWFYYDQNGTRVAMEHGGKLYYYLYNLQGDVIALCDASSKQIVAKYSYDAWGKLLTKENLGTGTIADVNPFRYRGYYYDSETGMYYLNSRYYDPEVGRFLNADVIMILENKPTVGNLFAYCKNTPHNLCGLFRLLSLF
ncbi:RHS repeat-associated core domain-containing protein [Yeguia hominis]|uniref:RHS repeat-associated core domain-containing protein n=1 Tax=Yeguia hominis TaxID=2763662 RepID=A0A926D8D8_9FIRM|nr:RHS repeat-associated core domain-containing protein [Yeguia hominis]MBC8533596.1 RHS repeat-associated core domain-containing protein [Yeguia hominis]